MDENEIDRLLAELGLDLPDVDGDGDDLPRFDDSDELEDWQGE